MSKVEDILRSTRPDGAFTMAMSDAKQQLLAEVLDMLRELHKNSASGSTTHDCSQDGYEYGLEDAIKAAKERFK